MKKFYFSIAMTLFSMFAISTINLENKITEEKKTEQKTPQEKKEKKKKPKRRKKMLAYNIDKKKEESSNIIPNSPIQRQPL